MAGLAAMCIILGAFVISPGLGFIALGLILLLAAVTD